LEIVDDMRRCVELQGKTTTRIHLST
jgi:hypothetical protein